MTEEGGTLRAGRVHDRADVVHPLLQCGRRGERHRIGHTSASLIEAQQSAKGSQPVEEARERWLFPHDVDVAGPSGNEDEVELPVPDHLIRNAAFGAFRVLCFRAPHSLLVPTGSLTDWALSCAAPR